MLRSEKVQSSSWGTFATMILKVIELFVTVVILVVFRTGNDGELIYNDYIFKMTRRISSDVFVITSGVIVGYLIINATVLITYVMRGGVIQKTILEVLFNIVGAIMFMVIGALAITLFSDEAIVVGYYQNVKNAGLGMGGLCIINGFIFALDTFFAFRNVAFD